MRWCCWVLTWLLPLCAAAQGVTHHMQRWTQAQGAPLAAFSLAQTADGLLWFATASGLFEFDGVRFRRHDALYGHALASSNINRVAAHGNVLLIGYQTGGATMLAPGLARDWKAGKDGLPTGTLTGFAIGGDGTVYAATSKGIVRLKDGGWQRLPGNGGSAAVSYLRFDRDGVLWATIGNALYARLPGSDTFRHVTELLASGDPMIVDGRLAIWAPGRGFLVLSGSGRHRLLAVEQMRKYGDPLFSGAGGTLWTMREDGLARLEARADGVLRAAEVFDSGGDVARAVLESMIDREGNLWVTTMGGVERYRPHRLRRAQLPGSMTQMVAQPGVGEEMWVGGFGAPVQRMGTPGPRRTIPVDNLTAIHRAGADQAWIGNHERLCMAGPAAHRCWPLPDGARGHDVQAITQDRAGHVWVTVSRLGLFRFDEGRWLPNGGLSGMPRVSPITMLTGSSGRTWFGYTRGRIGELGENGVRMLPETATGAIGNVLSMHEHGGRLLAGGDNGVAWLDGDAARPLRPARGEGFRGVAGIVADRNGDLWLHGTGGLFHVTAKELAAFFATPSRPVESELFDFADGLLGQVSQLRPLPALAVGHDGRIWYATASQAGWIDPAAIPRNPLPPTVLIRGLRTPRGDYPAAGGVALPERTTELDVSFTATALSIPERVRLRYRLHGVDAGWREVEHERQAHYTNLGPGSYRFDVIAANEDGVWNTRGATLAFSIAPTFWQTAWFRALCAAAAALLAWLAYRWRLAAATRLVNERAAARIAERERIARSLHDDLLQAVHGLMLQCQAAQQLAGEAPAARALDKALADADKLVASTRDEVMALRDEALVDELLAGVRATVETLEPGAAGKLRIDTAGHAVPLRGEAAAEIAHVLREAALNGYRHGQAGSIVLSLRFGASTLEGAVQDDGRGIDPCMAREGRTGHWGIVGMRERIARLGGTLDIGPAPRGGTLVRFRIPAHAAYHAAPRRARSLLARVAHRLRALHAGAREL